ncbi:endolytic transglycosylase MltG, partial [Mycobacterium tuberculosis]|nr:endolytic transglycosylase MltG [Mycobacterium tuberculosis]
PLATIRDLVVLASIVEKETGKPEERARVAAVFLNRLKRNMRLETDPTIIYGLYKGASWTEPRTLTKSEMAAPNPYNTYKINGLPPGPIANPG